MRKEQILLELDTTDGSVVDANGALLTYWAGSPLVSFDADTKDVETLVKLKNAGFTADEIVELSRKELI